MATSDRGPERLSRVTPARRVGDARPMPIGKIMQQGANPEQRERRMDKQSREAFEKGLQTGRKEGFDAARQQLAQEAQDAAIAAGGFAAQRLEKAVAGFESEFSGLERELADQVIELAIDLAQTVLRTELQERPQHIEHAVNDCLRLLGEQVAKLRLRMHPSDVQWIEKAIENQSITTDLTLCPDETVETGGCLIESPQAFVDGTIRTRWQRTLASIGKATDDNQ